MCTLQFDMGGLNTGAVAARMPTVFKAETPWLREHRTEPPLQGAPWLSATWVGTGELC